MEHVDIRSESIRVYVYENDGEERELCVHAPVTLYITDTGGHRVQDHNNWVHYIPKGWIALRWLPKVGRPAVVA